MKLDIGKRDGRAAVGQHKVEIFEMMEIEGFKGTPAGVCGECPRCSVAGA